MSEVSNLLTQALFYLLDLETGVVVTDGKERFVVMRRSRPEDGEDVISVFPASSLKFEQEPDPGDIVKLRDEDTSIPNHKGNSTVH